MNICGNCEDLLRFLNPNQSALAAITLPCQSRPHLAISLSYQYYYPRLEGTLSIPFHFPPGGPPLHRHLNLIRSLAVFALAVFALATCSLAAFSQDPPQSGPTDQQIQQRVDQLLQQMTLDEKIGQMTQQFVLTAPEPLEPDIASGKIGSLLFVTDPALINRLQHLAVEKSRLHIPLIFGYDVIHGFRTIFPVPLALAASWDPSVAQSTETVAADEASAVGINWAFAPMVDIARDPRWGRIVEGAGEDPYLGSAMAAAEVHGFQGSYIGEPHHILACLKHFAGYGAAEGGRDYEASDISDDQLHNVYLPPFHAGVEAGAGSVMSAYMDLNGVPATGNRYLLHDVLREQWHFQGFVVSDADAAKNLATHGYAANLADAAVRAVDAGVDMEMSLGSAAYQPGIDAAVKAGKVPAFLVAPLVAPSAIASTLADSVRSEHITMQQIDDANRYILGMKFRLGLFDHPYADLAATDKILSNPEHRVAARIAAERSAVLLRDENHLLPLTAGAYKKIAVIGPLADSQIDTLGSWAFQENLSETITVLQGLRDKSGSATEIDYAPGVQIDRLIPSPFASVFPVKRAAPWTPEQAAAEMSKAIDLAKASDLSILVLGENQDMSGESASRSSLTLPGEQEKLLESVVALGKPVVLVLLNGRPLDITWASQHVAAILEAWYPGTQGGAAIANLLYGSAVPGGKLPLTWPRNGGQIPIFYAHTLSHAPENQSRRYWDESSAPLYAFGYGLSYSTFSFSNLTLDRQQIHTGDTLNISVDVENTGGVTADEVAQLYIHQRYGSASRPVRELKGFKRITLAPQQKQTVRFTLGPSELRYWSQAKQDWVQDPSTFDVWTGDSSEAQLHSNFTVTAAQ